jgi:molybdate transport system substrate-binding protein
MRRSGGRLFVLLVSAALTAPALASDTAQVPLYPPYVYPPWQKDADSDVAERGLEFTVPEVDNLPDFHGNPIDAKLVLYVGGNYFFALAPLVKAFESQQPDLKGRIFWETLPPGQLVKQMEAGGTITVGNMTFTVKADAYFAGLTAVQRLVDSGRLEAPAVPYASNTLAIMVPKGNPARIVSLTDLGRSNIRLAMPNPDTEGVADQIKASLQKAGGQALVDTVYGTKARDGSTYLTAIHHRETPMFLMQTRRCRRHVAFRSDLSGAGGQPYPARRYSRCTEHDWNLCRRRCEGCRARGRREEMDRFSEIARRREDS